MVIYWNQNSARAGQDYASSVPNFVTRGPGMFPQNPAPPPAASGGQDFVYAGANHPGTTASSTFVKSGDG